MTYLDGWAEMEWCGVPPCHLCGVERSRMTYFTTGLHEDFPTKIIHRESTDKETFHGVSPFLVEKTISGALGEVKSTKKLRSGELLVKVNSPTQAKKTLNVQTLSTRAVTVTPHATLNSSKGVISCADLLNDPIENITKELSNQGVTHVRRITIRRNGQLLNTKHLILTFSSEKLPEYIKAGYMRLSVRAYIPNPLRCFNCQRFGHSKLACRGTLTCDCYAEVGHDSTDCTTKEKCINCKGNHTSFSRDCSAWKQEKETITTKITNQISYPEARKLVKSRTPAPGTSFASAIKKTPVAILTPTNQSDLPSETNSKTSGPLPATHSPVTTAGNILPPTVAPISEAAFASQDFSYFQIVNSKKKI
ncbi:hypothetical protein AVEN_156598-1 [Araneus ventricosus]|uniref:CCHC-type domain-containing protein n=1 Tax=Araneus ventricosus TaxID=182803 RepID=A0A4Y2EX96_ARAVE|nr:hypothetical protein AVEN_156598-1 [Araneus ventricosus]